MIGLRIHQHFQASAPASETPTQVNDPAPATPSATELVFPVQDHGLEDVISYFGDSRGNRSHQGIDIKAPRGTKVVAVTDGFIEKIREGARAGKSLYLRDAKGRLFFYAHLEDYDTEEFAAVEAGDVIGEVGNTGNAKLTSPHLHFEILLGKEKEPQDPVTYWE
nr:M23 family metallopeptidase [Lewinella sp. W8]